MTVDVCRFNAGTTRAAALDMITVSLLLRVVVDSDFRGLEL